MKLVAASVVILFLASATSAQRVFGFCTTSFTREKVPGRCRPLIKCVRFFHELQTLANRPCTLKSGEVGVCCPYSVPATTKPSKQSNFWHLLQYETKLCHILPVSCDGKYAILILYFIGFFWAFFEKFRSQEKWGICYLAEC